MTYQTILNSPDITQDIPNLLKDCESCAKSTKNLHENTFMLHRTGLQLQEILQEFGIEKSTIIERFDALKAQYKNITPEVANQLEDQIEKLRDAHRMCVAKLLIKQKKNTQDTVIETNEATMHHIGDNDLHICY